MPQIASTPGQLHVGRITAPLARLRRQVKRWLWTSGLARVLWIVAGLALASFVVEWTFRFDPAQRTVLLGLAVGLSGYGALRWLIRPLSRPLSDESLALEVERVHPWLRQSLITAVQFAKANGKARRGISPGLVERVIAEGARAAEVVSIDAVVDWQAQRRNIGLLLAAALVLCAIAAGAISWMPMQIWFARSVLLREVKWPQDTYLVIENVRADGTVMFPKGADWAQDITVRKDSRIIPQVVYLDTSDGVGLRSRPLTETGQGRFSATFSRVAEPFVFRVRGGDDVSDWVRVELVDPPALTSLKLLVAPPHYAGSAREELAAGQGPYAILAGSQLQVEATANKKLTRATLLVEGRLLVAGGRSDTKAAFPLESQRGNDLTTSISASMLLVGSYRLELEDAFGFREREPITFALDKRTDQVPRVSVRLPVTRGMVTPEARIPFECEVSDDFGLTSLRAVISWQGTDEQTAGERSLDFRNKVGDSLVAVGERSSVQDLRLDDALDLADLRAQGASELQPGASLQIVFESADNDDVSGPNRGQSAVFLLRVVTSEELRADLLRREKELRAVFARGLQDQEALVVESRALAAILGGEPSARADVRHELAELYRRQKDLGKSTGEMAERFAQIAADVQSNRLEDDAGNLQNRLTEEIVRPLRRATEVVEIALSQLDKARWAQRTDEQKSAVEAAGLRQTETATVMRDVLRHMIESESFQEAVNMLLEIQQAQSAVHEQTNKARDERVRRLLEGNRGTGSNDRPMNP